MDLPSATSRCSSSLLRRYLVSMRNRISQDRVAPGMLNIPQRLHSLPRRRNALVIFLPESQERNLLGRPQYPTSPNRLLRLSAALLHLRRAWEAERLEALSRPS